MYYGLNMSFIERMRAEKAEADRKATEARARENESSSQAHRQREESRRQFQQAQQQDKMQAAKHLHQSGAAKMANDLASAIGGSVADYSDGTIKLSWDRQDQNVWSGRDEYHIVSGKKIEITSTSDGKITIEGGGLFGSGSTTLFPEQLKRNPELLERAIEKAYKQPKSYNEQAPRTQRDPENPDTYNR